MFPTPTTRHNMMSPSMQKWPGHRNLQLGSLNGGALNPTWVEWLMGFPEGWTALDASEMPLSRKSSKKSAEPSCSAAS
jgi:hypothetical protein